MTDEELRALRTILEDRQKANETLHQQTIDQVNKWAQSEGSAIESRKETAVKNEDKSGVEKADKELAQVEERRASWLRLEDGRYDTEKSGIAADGQKVDEMRNRHELEKKELADRQAAETAERKEAMSLHAEKRKEAEAERAKETEKAPVSDPAKTGIKMVATGLEVAEGVHAVYAAVTKGEVPNPAELVVHKFASEYAKELAGSKVDEFRQKASETAAWVVGSDPKKIDQTAREHNGKEQSSEKNQVLREVQQSDLEAGKEAAERKFDNTQKQESQTLDTQHQTETKHLDRMLRPPPPPPPPPPKQENNVEDTLHP